MKFGNFNGVKCAIRDDIWEAVEGKATGKQVMSDDKLSNYPSEIGDCKRKIYYRWTGAKKDGRRDFAGQRVMMIGTLLHPFFGQMWSRAGFFLNEECHASNSKINASFRPDFIGIIRTPKMAKLFDMEVGELFVIDFKTTSNRSYEYYDRGTKTPGIPKESDELQLQFYVGEVQKYLKDDKLCRYGFLQYFSRDWSQKFWNGRWKQNSQFKHDVALFQIPADPLKYQMGVNYFKEVQKLVDAKKVPKKEGAGKDNYPCSYCDYCSLCWK